MADSAITKKALANALKLLICDVPFSKISISDICDICEMNRKSFYYHFKDKYDLVNWIFDTEFSSNVKSCGDELLILELCRYLYINRDFYRRAFKIEGQNSFRSHFSRFITEYISTRIQGDHNTASHTLKAYFYSDGLVCAIERWLLSKHCTLPDDFYALVSSLSSK